MGSEFGRVDEDGLAPPSPPTTKLTTHPYILIPI